MMPAPTEANLKKWDKKDGTNDYVTGKILVQNAASLAGKVIIEYVPLS